MRLHFLLVALCGSALAQYDDETGGSPVPQRAIIPGSIPLSSGRPQFRPRPQGRVLQGPGGAPGGPAVRLRRPGATARGGRLQQPQFASTLSTGEPQISRSTSAPLGPTPPLPAILAQARPLSPVSTISPRPIQEDPIEDELPEDDLETDPQPLPIPSSTPLPSSLPSRPQNLQPAVFRPTRPAFRPERPIDDIPVPTRQQLRQPIEDIPIPTRQQYRQPVEDIIPVRQQVRQQPRPATIEPQFTRQPQQNTRQQQAARPPPQQQFSKGQREKKPVAQIVRRYREDNADGSITWGYENDDGSFKEETIGVDCVVRGKYGYTDPDGLRREYTYSSGIPCDKEEEERKKQSNEGFVDYGNNKYVLPNGDSIDLDSVIKNKARKPVAHYRN
ncbi:translation initiation factor IF-2 [Periplaneta americana]|uniref:translation initiation factor IF-2 n=1 Tax=Periplaneta americana TaxID=6978 RepID=UPI0037E8D967